jgi:polyhydroxyalkanoate synthesis regulator phasin
MPFEFMKKAMMIGVGLAMKTQAEIEELTKEFVDKTKMSEEEGRKFFDDMVKKYEDARKDMEKKIRDGIAEYMDKADIASKKELDALKTELEELKKACGR